MSDFTFIPEQCPFPQWMGPFSPSRGTYSGFRVRDGWIRAWIDTDKGMECWSGQQNPGITRLVEIVRNEWQGGRVLFLPNGFVVKPLQKDDEVCKRVLIGRFEGAVSLVKPNNTLFNMNEPGNLSPGWRWPGPRMTGLECVILSDGRLTCSWYHPTRTGREEEKKILRRPDYELAKTFRRVRLGDNAGRVRVTANGHIITNLKALDGTWTCVYLGYINPADWESWEKWINREGT